MSSISSQSCNDLGVGHARALFNELGQPQDAVSDSFRTAGDRLCSSRINSARVRHHINQRFAKALKVAHASSGSGRPQTCKLNGLKPLLRKLYLATEAGIQLRGHNSVAAACCDHGEGPTCKFKARIQSILAGVARIKIADHQRDSYGESRREDNGNCAHDGVQSRLLNHDRHPIHEGYADRRYQPNAAQCAAHPISLAHRLSTAQLFDGV